MADQVQVQGADRLAATLHDAADDVADLAAANADTGQLVADRTRALAPKVTGQLAGSVWAEALPDRAVVHIDAPYAAPINYGWAARNITPNPYATDALDQSSGAVQARMGQELDSILGRVKGA